MIDKRTFLPACVLLAALFGAPGAHAQSDAADAGASEATAQPDEAGAQAVRRMLTIRKALADRRERIRTLIEQLEAADESDKPRIRDQIAVHRDVIRDLTASFGNIASGGAVLRDSGDAENRRLDWNQELNQILRPILSGLKDATEKPRRIAELRTAIDLHERQLEVARRAIASVNRFDRQTVPPEVAEGLDSAAASWRDRIQDIERLLESARIELQNLELQDAQIFESMGQVASEFLLGSGLTLLLALVVGLVVWFLLHALQRLVRKLRRSAAEAGYAAQMRLLLYSYNILSAVLVTLSVLAVFYARGDFLLLSLSIIVLAMLVLGMWRFLPGYVAEARLLLNVGAARQGERVIYDGLPFCITSLNLYSELRNPELEGVIRLPLSALAQLTSRPRTDETWFPSRVGDYLLMPDGGFAQVLRQTVEMVQLKLLGSLVQYASADFLQLNSRNLSREGFGVVVAFGIDYDHQAIALDRVPERFHAGIRDAFEQAGFGDDLKDLVVDFKEAGASSLDYLVYATFDGNRAAYYFKIVRMVQQACVDVCNREGWVIPFTQVTVHSAAALSAPESGGAGT